MNLLKKNLSFNLIFTVFSTISSFIVMRYMFMYFNNDKSAYGLWLTVYSVLSYIYMMDFGFSNGLRNIITPIARRDRRKVNDYISNNYLFMIIVTFFLTIVVNISMFLIDFNFMYQVKDFNLDIIEFKNFIILIVNLQMLYFFLSCIKPVFHAYSKTYFVNLSQFISNLLVIAFVSLSIRLNINGDWSYIAIMYVGSQIISIIIFSIIIIKLEKLEVKIHFNKNILIELFEIGNKFFFLQLSNLILFNSLPIVLSMLVSLKEVSMFQVSLKIMSLFMMIFTIIMAPVWTYILNENDKKNIENIKFIHIKIIKIFLLVSISILTTSLFLDIIVSQWMGEDFKFSLIFKVTLSLFVMFTILCSIYQGILNGLHIFKVQIVGYLTGSLFLIIASTMLYIYNIHSLTVVMIIGMISLLIPVILMHNAYSQYIKKGLMI